MDASGLKEKVIVEEEITKTLSRGAGKRKYGPEVLPPPPPPQVTCAFGVHNILTTVMTNRVVDNNAANAEPHSIC